MDFIKTLFFDQSALQAVIVIFMIAALGLLLNRIRVFGISLGITYVFFSGIVFGHLGFSINADMLTYAESFGLVLFVYALGLQVGNSFFSSLRQGGFLLNGLAVGVVLLGTLLAVLIAFFTSVDLSDMMGILCGATTNTPALGAAQQTLRQLGLPEMTPALGCAVAYPMGVIGVVLGMVIIKFSFKKQLIVKSSHKRTEKEACITSFHIDNPAIFYKTIKEIASLVSPKFVISRVWRKGALIIPSSKMCLEPHDRILVALQECEQQQLTVLFGSHDKDNWNRDDIDWDALDSDVFSQRYVITNREINGKRLGSLRFRNLYGVNISRVLRGEIELLATPELVLQVGDRLSVVGEKQALHQVENLLGNRIRTLKEPNLLAVFIGMILGLIVGAIPIHIGAMTTPIKLGLAGGPIIVGILIGTFGHRLRMITFVTRSANLMLQRLGLTLYLACLGLNSGAHFAETIMQGQGILWILLGSIITIVPVVIVGIIALKCYRLDYGIVCGMLCGSMANPMALKYADDITDDDSPSVSYTTVYPLCMFLRVIIIQIVLLFFL